LIERSVACEHGVLPRTVRVVWRMALPPGFEQGMKGAGGRYGILRFYSLEWDDDRDDSKFGE
jgi:hypothetical protein